MILAFHVLIWGLLSSAAGQESAGNFPRESASPLPAETASSPALPDHFPLKDGLSWKYRSNLGEAVSWVKLTGRECIVYSESPSLDSEQHLSLGDEGVLLLSTRSTVVFVTTTRTYRPPLLRLPLPIQPGQKWHWAGEELVDDEIIHSRVDGEVMGEETIKVPAGEFKCLKVRAQTVSDDGTVSSSIQWLANGVGVVKAEISVEAAGFNGFLISLLGMDSFTLELKEINPPGSDR